MYGYIHRCLFYKEIITLLMRNDDNLNLRGFQNLIGLKLIGFANSCEWLKFRVF
jgi:hypothetical protein